MPVPVLLLVDGTFYFGSLREMKGRGRAVYKRRGRELSGLVRSGHLSQSLYLGSYRLGTEYLNKSTDTVGHYEAGNQAGKETGRSNKVFQGGGLEMLGHRQVLDLSATATLRAADLLDRGARCRQNDRCD